MDKNKKLAFQMILIYGISWFLGSAVMGFLYDIKIEYVILFAVGAEILSIPVLFLLRRVARIDEAAA